jgi:hypothetical protein
MYWEGISIGIRGGEGGLTLDLGGAFLGLQANFTVFSKLIVGGRGW